MIKIGTKNEVVQQYLNKNKNKNNITEDLKTLQAISTDATSANILSTIGTILASLSIIGLVITIPFYIAPNYKKRGSGFMFDDSGAKQKAQVVEYLLNKHLKSK